MSSTTTTPATTGMDEVLDKKASKALFTSSYPWILLASIIILGAVLYL